MTPLLGEQREPALGRPRRAGIRCLALGAVFGALASLLKISPPPYGEVGGKVVDAGWRWVMPVPEFASLLLGVGWAWAGLAVAAGWLAGTRARGAAAGVLALIAATATYYCMRSVLRREAEMLRWWLASVLLGAALGAVGASISCTGLIGWLASLAVPAGAILKMILRPPGWDVDVSSAAIAARVTVMAAAAFPIGAIATRHHTLR